MESAISTFPLMVCLDYRSWHWQDTHTIRSGDLVKQLANLLCWLCLVSSSLVFWEALRTSCYLVSVDLVVLPVSWLLEMVLWAVAIWEQALPQLCLSLLCQRLQDWLSFFPFWWWWQRTASEFRIIKVNLELSGSIHSAPPFSELWVGKHEPRLPWGTGK